MQLDAEQLDYGYNTTEEGKATWWGKLRNSLFNPSPDSMTNLGAMGTTYGVYRSPLEQEQYNKWEEWAASRTPERIHETLGERTSERASSEITELLKGVKASSDETNALLKEIVTNTATDAKGSATSVRSRNSNAGVE